jgi:hypothetical protein
MHLPKLGNLPILGDFPLWLLTGFNYWTSRKKPMCDLFPGNAVWHKEFGNKSLVHTWTWTVVTISSNKLKFSAIANLPRNVTAFSSSINLLLLYRLFLEFQFVGFKKSRMHFLYVFIFCSYHPSCMSTQRFSDTICLSGEVLRALIISSIRCLH